MTTNGDIPPRQPGDRDTPDRVIRDDLDAVDDTVAKITDAEVEEQLRRVLDQSGHAGPIPEQVWQDFNADPLSVLGACGTSTDASLVAAASQTAAEIVGAARRRARLLEKQARAAQESVTAAHQEAEQIAAYARAIADAALGQAATMIRDAREKAARIINDAHTDAEQILKAAHDRHGQLVATGGGGAGVLRQFSELAEADGHPPAIADRDYARLEACSVVGVSAVGSGLTALTSWLLRAQADAGFPYRRGHLSAPPADPWQALKTPHHGASTKGQFRWHQWEGNTLQILLVVEGLTDEISSRRWLTGYPYSPPRVVVFDSCGAQVDTGADLIYALGDQVHACQVRLWKCLRHRLNRTLTTPVTSWQVERRAAPEPTAGEVMTPLVSLTTPRWLHNSRVRPGPPGRPRMACRWARSGALSMRCATSATGSARSMCGRTACTVRGGGGWKRSDLAMVIAVKRPAGESRGKVAAGPDTRSCHRASPRPYRRCRRRKASSSATIASWCWPS